jgi:hypothetical protein
VLHLVAEHRERIALHQSGRRCLELFDCVSAKPHALGFIWPDERAQPKCFVPILQIDGVQVDSDPMDNFRECGRKNRFLISDKFAVKSYSRAGIAKYLSWSIVVAILIPVQQQASARTDFDQCKRL